MVTLDELKAKFIELYKIDKACVNVIFSNRRIKSMDDINPSEYEKLYERMDELCKRKLTN